MRSKELQRVGLLEGRKALGWGGWRETITPYGLTMLAEALAAAIEAGQIEPADPNRACPPHPRRPPRGIGDHRQRP